MYLDEPVLSDDVCSAKNSYDAYYDEDIMICAGYANGEWNFMTGRYFAVVCIQPGESQLQVPVR